MASSILPNKFYNRKKRIEKTTDELLITASEIIKVLYQLEAIILSSKLIMNEFREDPTLKKLLNLRDKWTKLLITQDEEHNNG